MKTLLVRMGALVTLAVLGWIAMARAQRDGDAADPLANAIALTRCADRARRPTPHQTSRWTRPPPESKSGQMPLPRRLGMLRLQAGTRATVDPFGPPKRPARWPAPPVRHRAGLPRRTTVVKMRAHRTTCGVMPASHQQDVVADGNVCAASATSGPALTAADLDAPPQNPYRPGTVSAGDGGGDLPPPTPSRPDSRTIRPMPVYGRPAGMREANLPDQPVARGSVAQIQCGQRQPGRFRVAGAGAVPSRSVCHAHPRHARRKGAGGLRLGGGGRIWFTEPPRAKAPDSRATRNSKASNSAVDDPKVGARGKSRWASRPCSASRSATRARSAAAQVEVHDQVPKGTRLLGTTPQAKRDASGEMVWTLGTIRPRRRGDRRDASDADGRGRDRQRGDGPFRRRRLGPHVATRPQLAIETTAPSQGLDRRAGDADDHGLESRHRGGHGRRAGRADSARVCSIRPATNWNTPWAT